jgi:predicted nucleic acid-binding Zn ribbon protein
MKKKVLVFLLAVGLSLLGAVFEWGDSAHSIGLVSVDGGRARHPVVLPSGRDRYMLIATATVLPPYRGDVRLALEGDPPIATRISASAPIVDLGLHHWPRLEGGVLSGLEPRDRLAVWVEMRPPRLDPVCGMALGDAGGFCSEECRERFRQAPERYRGRDRVRGSYVLSMKDTGTGRPVLSVPIEFVGEGGRRDAGGHQH